MQSAFDAWGHADCRKGGPSHLVIYHQGSLPGALTAVNLVPDTESVIVLTRSLSLNDTADRVSQLVLEELLGVPERDDYIKVAEYSVAENAKWYSSTFEQLRNEQKLGSSPKDLEQYGETYWDEIHGFKIVVVLEEGPWTGLSGA